MKKYPNSDFIDFIHQDIGRYSWDFGLSVVNKDI